MTSSLGIAATTAVLRRLLQNAIPSADLSGVLGQIDVTAIPPDRIDVASEKSSLNLFMYQARPNTGWANEDLPSHTADSRRRTNPPLALDLHYMLSAYGAGNFHSEILLGYGALVLHQTRVLVRDMVKATFAGGGLPADLALLSTAELDAQEELVKLTLEPLSIDDLSRLWSVFGEKYRPSIAFRATVVLLRGTDPTTSVGPPVQTVELQTTTSIHPTVTAVEPAMATTGQTVAIVGTGLLTAGTTVVFGSGATVTPSDGSTDTRLTVDLPADLPAGVDTLRVQLPQRFTTGLRGGPESNVVPFMVRPAFAPAASGRADIAITNRSSAGDTTTATLVARLVPPVGKRQRVTLFLDETSVPDGTTPHSYAVQAPSREADVAETTDIVAFAIAVHRADYAIRVRVDGAETELLPTGGVYDRPQVDLS